jgi:hypothetical protein
MDFIAEVTKNNIDDYLYRYNIIACKIRSSRLKAKQIAILEILFAQIDNEILAIKNGPLGDIKGMISFFCPKDKLDSFRERLFGIGYCSKFYLLDFEDESCKNNTDLRPINPLVWKGCKFSVTGFFAQDKKIYEDQSPNKREFKIVDFNGEVKTVPGYRGDGTELGRRALPVEDARCMVNLSLPQKNKRLLDPFAGAGGIIYGFKYIAPNGTAASIDIDPVLKPGLEFYGSAHHVMNAADASFPANSFDSVVTEVPFAEDVIDTLTESFKKINPCVSEDGVYVIMCEDNQTPKIYDTMTELGNYCLFTHEVDRKGMDVELSIWWKNKNLFPDMENFIEILKEIF